MYYDPRSLDVNSKISELAKLYEKKVGIKPKACLVNVAYDATFVDEIELIPDKSMFSLNYFCLGYRYEK